MSSLKVLLVNSYVCTYLIHVLILKNSSFLSFTKFKVQTILIFLIKFMVEFKYH